MNTMEIADMTLNLGDPAPDLTLPNQDGEVVAFSQCWQQMPTAFVFLRHFG